MFRRIAGGAIAALFLLAGNAFAATTTGLVQTSGTGTALIDDYGYAAFWVEENTGPPVGGLPGGSYVVHNNTTNLTLLGFGVTNTNPEARAFIKFWSDACGCWSPRSGGYVEYSDAYGFDYWGALNLDAGTWDLGDRDGVFGDADWNRYAPETLWGHIGDALLGEPNGNYYQVVDGSGLGPMLSARRFIFVDALPASSMFGVAYDAGTGTTFAFINAPVVTTGMPAVPLPAAGWLLVAGLAALAGLGRRTAA